MSGICGLLRLDGEPIELQVLDRMTALLAFRGPDSQSTWREHCIGLGHSLLCTTSEPAQEHQPLTLDGKTWITADARVDGQKELRHKLASKGRTILATATDAELILHAYQAWGDDCLSHLIGDFAFAVWDGPRQRLLCARDHFGVKPFFYGRSGQELVFSNTLDCVRSHPRISNSLNELAIADFLMFDGNQDPGTTAFADIKRLPPGNCLVCSSAGIEVKRYWSLPVDLDVRYRSNDDYVEHFRMILEQAVSDRIRSDRIGVAMSGGLDSTSVAAVARNVLARRAGAWELRAHTVAFDHLIPDSEPQFARVAAAHLGIPLHCLVADHYKLYQHQLASDFRVPEPIHNPDLVVPLEFARQAARHCRVMLTGWDGDALLNESPKPYLRELLRQGRWMTMLMTAARYQISEGRAVPRTIGNWFRPGAAVGARSPSSLPVWIAKDFEQRLHLRARWSEINSRPSVSHPVRPYAFRSFSMIAQCSNFFDLYDPGTTRCAVEFRHPLLDLRLLQYCLSLPPVPWCVKKDILRSAMLGSLPDTIRTRAKTPSAGAPYLARLHALDACWVDDVTFEQDLGTYVDTAMIPMLWRAVDADESWTNLRPLSLNVWMKGLSQDRFANTNSAEQCLT
jgi:asparagine synthase (glutamine-hydrolysing)